jgi:diguanylate cyclase (GGDEF)-like protein
MNNRADACAARLTWTARLHEALMPDYNRAAAAYWWGMLALGLLAAGVAAGQIAQQPLDIQIQVALGCVVAAMAGFYPVRVPGSKNSFAAGEVFIFLLLLMHGPAAAVLAAAGEAFVGSVRSSKRWTSRLVSPALAAIAVTVTGTALHLALELLQARGALNEVLLLVTAMAFAATYFLLNTALITIIPHLKRGEPMRLAGLMGSFGWVGITYAASSLIAGLLYLAFKSVGIGVLVAGVPIIVMLLSMLHIYFRKRELDDAANQVRIDAAEREAQAAAHHAQQLQHIAFHDSLTGLANRARFRECLAQAIGRAQADPKQVFAVMYLDFDRFKLINDTLGHSVGDQFLIAATQRIVQHVRPRDVVGRLGGDEFAILIEPAESEAVILALAERLQAALCEPYRVGGTEVNSSASIGITLSTVGYQTPDEVLRDADIAMYRAKASGRAQHAVFDTALRARLSDQVQIEGDLRGALDSGQITLAYQPIYDLYDGHIVAFEALARWHHPQRGTIDPHTFVPVAEDCGLIGALTAHVLARACSQLRAWQQLGERHRHLRMQVNLSGLDLNQGELAMQVATTLLANGLEASQLTLEITESKLMTGLSAAFDTLTRLRDIGVGISVDDFGTGYSSLSYLSTLPISSLKVDRSFVHQMAKATKDTEIVKAVIGLGNVLGKTVIAEGIETPAQLSQLRALGCRYGQGRLLAPPLAPEMARDLLLTGVADASHDATPPADAAQEPATVH